MEKEMELMDWKDIESGAESQLRDARKQKALALILLAAARLQIKDLGGRTNEEEDETAKNIRGDSV